MSHHHQKSSPCCKKCRKNHKYDRNCHNQCDRNCHNQCDQDNTQEHIQDPICVYLAGKMIGDHLYQPPINDLCRDRQETINLKTIGYLRRCNVQGIYGELENRGLLFQNKDKGEIQINYYSEKQAESEYNILTILLAKL